MDLEKQETQEIEQKSYNKTLEILIFDREKSSRIRYDTVWVLWSLQLKTSKRTSSGWDLAFGDRMLYIEVAF